MVKREKDRCILWSRCDVGIVETYKMRNLETVRLSILVLE